MKRYQPAFRKAISERRIRKREGGEEKDVWI